MFDGELGLDVEPVHHFRELLERNLPVEVFVRLDNRPVDQLLQLWLRQVVSNHHLEHREQLPVANEPVVVDVVDLKRKFQLLLVRRYTSVNPSLPPLESELSPSTNSRKDILPSLFLSSTSITRLTSGLLASSGGGVSRQSPYLGYRKFHWARDSRSCPCQAR